MVQETQLRSTTSVCLGLAGHAHMDGCRVKGLRFRVAWSWASIRRYVVRFIGRFGRTGPKPDIETL